MKNVLSYKNDIYYLHTNLPCVDIIEIFIKIYSRLNAGLKPKREEVDLVRMVNEATPIYMGKESRYGYDNGQYRVALDDDFNVMEPLVP